MARAFTRAIVDQIRQGSYVTGRLEDRSMQSRHTLSAALLLLGVFLAPAITLGQSDNGSSVSSPRCGPNAEHDGAYSCVSGQQICVYNGGEEIGCYFLKFENTATPLALDPFKSSEEIPMMVRATPKTPFGYRVFQQF